MDRRGKRKYNIYFKNKIFLVIYLDDSKLRYVYNYKYTKQIYSQNDKWSFSKYQTRRMNTQGEEVEWFIHKYFSKFRKVINYIGTFVTNQYLIVKNWNKKFDPIL